MSRRYTFTLNGDEYDKTVGYTIKVDSGGEPDVEFFSVKEDLSALELETLYKDIDFRAEIIADEGYLYASKGYNDPYGRWRRE